MLDKKSDCYDYRVRFTCCDDFSLEKYDLLDPVLTVGEYIPKICRKKIRCGVIPYYIDNDQPYFCLGLDSMYKELTDFGGSICRSDSASIFKACSRELREESKGIFNFTTVCFTRCLCVYNKESIIFFIACTYESYINSVSRFRESSNRNMEMKDIIWVNEKDLRDIMAKKKNIYCKTRNLINKWFDEICSLIKLNAYYCNNTKSIRY